MGLPIWFAVGILVTFAPEFGAALHMTALPAVGTAVLWCYVGLALGDLSSGALSQVLRSRRKRVVGIYLVGTGARHRRVFRRGPALAGAFYACCFALGRRERVLGLFVSIAAEVVRHQRARHGRHHRAQLRARRAGPDDPGVQGAEGPLGVVYAALAVGAVTVTLASIALRNLDETYGREMDYVER